MPAFLDSDFDCTLAFNYFVIRASDTRCLVIAYSEFQIQSKLELL